MCRYTAYLSLSVFPSHPLTDMHYYLIPTGSIEPYDFAFSYSSLEHDGLARYGDPLNPFGDLESIARVHCLLRPGGLFFLGFPVAYDAVIWNAHRIYGQLRLQLVLNQWELVEVIADRPLQFNDKATLGHWYNQPILVLRKPLN